MSTTEKPRLMPYRRHVLVCVGPRCTDGAGQALYEALGEKLKAAGLNRGALRVKRTRATCFGACRGGPLLCVQPDGVWYWNVTESNLDRIIEQHLLHGRVIEELAFHRGPACLASADG